MYYMQFYMCSVYIAIYLHIYMYVFSSSYLLSHPKPKSDKKCHQPYPDKMYTILDVVFSGSWIVFYDAKFGTPFYILIYFCYMKETGLVHRRLTQTHPEKNAKMSKNYYFVRGQPKKVEIYGRPISHQWHSAQFYQKNVHAVDDCGDNFILFITAL